MRPIRSILAAAAIVAIAACNMVADAEGGDPIPGKGSGGARTFDVGEFRGVGLAGRHDVIVTTGAGHSVRAEGDSAELDRLEIEVRNGTLRIGEKREFMNIRDRGKVTVYVTAPRIESAAIGGSGNLTVDKAEGDSLDASIAGSGNLDIGAIRVTKAQFAIAGSGNITGKGSADRASASIAGSGDMNLSGFEAEDADVSIVGSGDVTMRAKRTADVSVMGSGDVTLGGNPKCDVTKAGSGSVRCTG